MTVSVITTITLPTVKMKGSGLCYHVLFLRLSTSMYYCIIYATILQRSMPSVIFTKKTESQVLSIFFLASLNFMINSCPVYKIICKYMRESRLRV